MIPKLFLTRIFVVFVILATRLVYCRPDPDGGDDHGDKGGCGGKGGGADGGGGLTVVISFDSLDCRSKDFFNSKLKPVYDEMSKCVKWHFIPCSTSHIVDDVLHCKDGVEECKIDALHACAAHYYENNENSLGKFFLCMMASGDQMCDAQKCASSSGLDWNKLKACKPSNEAGQWCDNRFKQLNTIHEPYIPGVIYDWKYNEQAENEAKQDLKKSICRQIQQKKLQCAACGNGSGGGGGGAGDGKDNGGGGKNSPGGKSGGGSDEGGKSGGGGGNSPAGKTGAGGGGGLGPTGVSGGSGNTNSVGGDSLPAGYLYNAQGQVTGVI